jgi:hypothetical protein
LLHRSPCRLAAAAQAQQAEQTGQLPSLVGANDHQREEEGGTPDQSDDRDRDVEALVVAGRRRGDGDAGRAGAQLAGDCSRSVSGH